jgi:predicted DNA-binding protein
MSAQNLKSDKKSVFMSIRLTEELREQIRQEAKKSQRTLAGQVLHYVTRSIEQEQVKIIHKL